MPKLTNSMRKELQETSRQLRLKVLEMIHKTRSPHIGSSFSIIELLTVLYFRHIKTSIESAGGFHDKFILSKGHACASLYAVLWKKGLISERELEMFAVDDGMLEHHPTLDPLRGIESSSGSLGHGLSVGAGLAYAARHDGADKRVYVMLSDGECNEGSIWEAAMFAAHQGLDNLTAIVDYNKIQATGRTSQVNELEPFADKWRSFGWSVREIDGHDIPQIDGALGDAPFQQGKPSLILAHTVKGKGVSFMEDDLLWHYRPPDEKEYALALEELK